MPVVILSRLAVSRQDQGRCIGTGLLQDAIRRTRLIASPLREQQLLLLKDARRWVG